MAEVALPVSNPGHWIVKVAQNQHATRDWLHFSLIFHEFMSIFILKSIDVLNKIKFHKNCEKLI